MRALNRLLFLDHSFVNYTLVLPVNILVVVGVVVGFSGSGGASKALVLASRVTLAVATKVGGGRVGENGDFFGISDIGE